jgi:NitT/TauT family transport system ATP-binding protein
MELQKTLPPSLRELPKSSPWDMPDPGATRGRERPTRIAPDGSPPAVRVDGLTKTFGRRGRRVPVFNNLDLSVEKGEFLCLLGPSGCGKSTLLSAIAGILPYDKGSVAVDGTTVTGPGADRGMLFQSPMLFSWLTVRDNVLFGPRARGLMKRARSEFGTRADEMLRTVGLSGFGEAYPHELSGGMRHRVAFARALLNDPSVLLMDEPFGALDAMTRSRMHAFLISLWEARRLTIVFVTHDIEEAVLLGDRICVFGNRPAGIIREFEVPLDRPRRFEDLEERAALMTKRSIRETLWAAA